MLRIRLAVIALLAATACGGSAASPAPSASAAPATLNVGFSEPVADNIPLWIALDAGYFSKRNLTVNATQITSTQGIPALLSGQVELDNLGGSEVMSAAAKGADLTILATLTPYNPYLLYAAPGINSPGDLKGKKAAITKPGASLDIALHVALQRYGVDPYNDVTYIQTGSVPNVITAMVSGQTQVTVSKPPESLKLDQAGLKVLLDLAKEKLPVANTGITARRSWVAANRDVAQRYVDAIIEAIAREKSDRAYAIAELAKWAKSDDAAANNASYDRFSVLVQSLPYPKPEQLGPAQAQLGRTDEKVKNYDVTKLMDPSFVQNAANRGLGK